MGNTAIEDGSTAATEVSKTILGLMEKGLDPAAIAVATTGIGLAMLIKQYGEINGGEIGHGLLEKAKSGELPLYPGLTASNINIKDED